MEFFNRMTIDVEANHMCSKKVAHMHITHTFIALVGLSRISKQV